MLTLGLLTLSLPKTRRTSARLIVHATSSARMVRETCQWVQCLLGSLLHQMIHILMSSTKRISLVN
nr:MAG TPA: hypothetical protein [Caudoviricetes sp.]